MPPRTTADGTGVPVPAANDPAHTETNDAEADENEAYIPMRLVQKLPTECKGFKTPPLKEFNGSREKWRDY